MSAATPKNPKPAAAPDAGKPPLPAATGFDDEEDDNGPWRHAPVAPKDEGVATSLGKAVSDVVTGPLDRGGAKPKTP